MVVDKLKLKMIYSDLKKELAQIESMMEQTIHSQSPLLQSASLHLLHAGGKRIRPVFVLLGAKFGTATNAHTLEVASAIEMIHMASLVHDDVIDDAELRRGKPTVKSEWNNRVAMYTGDFIFAKALQTISNFNNPLLHQLLSDVMVEICLGEVIQIQDKFNTNQRIHDYFRRIKRKTALLISSSSQLGAISAGADRQTVRTLKRFGYYVGMSFQIMDDILDLTSTEKELGKPAGSDLLQGNITLPILLLPKDSDLRIDIFSTLQRNEMTEQRLEMFIEQLKKTYVIEQSRQISDHYLKKALHELEKLPNIDAKKSLYDIAFYMSNRKF